MSDALHIVCPRCDTVNRVPEARLRQQPRCGQCHEPLFEGRPLELTESSFQRHVGHSGVPVLVDFWAPWCEPCRMMAPVFEQAAARFEPRLRLARLNTDAAPEIAARCGIRSIPTLILFRDGREVARQSGALDLTRLSRWLESQLPMVA